MGYNMTVVSIGNRTVVSGGRQRRFYRAAGQIETALPQQTKPDAQQRVCVPFEMENERNGQSPPAGGLCLFRLFAMRKKDFRFDRTRNLSMIIPLIWPAFCRSFGACRLPAIYFVSRKRDRKINCRQSGKRVPQQNPSMFSLFAMLYDCRFDMTALWCFLDFAFSPWLSWRYRTATMRNLRERREYLYDTERTALSATWILNPSLYLAYPFCVW